MLLLHIGAFHLDVDSQRSSLWHHLLPRTRVACALLMVFATALTPNGHWWTWGIYASGLLLLIYLCQVTVPILLQRVTLESAFISVVLLGTLFRGGGVVLWQWGWVQVTTHGLIVLGSVSLKALLCLFMLNLLVLTTPIPALLQALLELKLPPLLVAVMAAMYRYIAVLVDEFTTMRRAAASRNLMGRKHYQRLVIGNMIGSLFIRTYERGDRIHQAMLARGYQGLPAAPSAVPNRYGDWVALGITGLLVVSGQIIYSNAYFNALNPLNF